MKGFRLLEAEQLPMLVDVPKPKAGSGQVVNKVGGAGLCHTDLALIRRKKALHALALGIERIGLVSLRFPMAVAFVVIALAIRRVRRRKNQGRRFSQPIVPFGHAGVQAI